MEASSVLHQVMNSHSLDEVLGCGKQAAHNTQQQQQQQQQMMHSHHSPGEQQHPHHLHHQQQQQDQQQQLAAQQQQQQQQQQSASDPSKRLKPQPEQALRCPRCDSTNTKFCYYNNYSLSQPRYFCKGCRRYWTQGGTLRNVPVGGGCRKKRPSSASSMVVTAAKLNKIQVVTSSAGQEHHCSPVPTPDPASSPLHLPQHSTGAPTAASSTLGYDPSDLSLAFARLQQKTQHQHVEDHAAAFLHLLPGGTGGGQTAVSAAPTSSGAGSGFLDFLRGGSGFLDGGGAFCNPYGSSGFSGSGLLLGSGGDSDAPLLPIGEVGSPVVVKQEPGSRGVLDGGDANSKGGATSTSSSMMGMMGFHHHHLHHQWAAPHQQVQMQHPFMLGGNAAAAAAVGGADVGFASGLGGTAIDYWSTFGPAASWHGLVNSSLM